MSRAARVVARGVPHHITQRGNNKQQIFFDDEDRSAYVSILQAKAREYGLLIHAYCLMPNHIHLVATPLRDESLAKGVGRTHHAYTRHVHQRHSRSGHLWQNRFFSCPLDEHHFLAAVRYVERNPVRATLTEQAWDYPWSSARSHVAGHDPRRLIDFRDWPIEYVGERWRALLRTAEHCSFPQNLQQATFAGVPLGKDSFLSKLELMAGRPLRPRRQGRPSTQ